MTRLYSVNYLERCADQYAAMRLHAHGVTLDQYLADPARYEHLALEPEPLLPQQRAVQARIDAEEAAARLENELDSLPRRNGAVIEPLHHNRYPRRQPAAHFKGRRAEA